MTFGHRLLVLLALFFAPSFAMGQAPGSEIHVHAGLEAETLAPAPGSTVTLAITMRPDPGWHGYWRNPGDAGEGLQLQWIVPSGVRADEPQFPVPDRLVISGFMNYVYERPHAMLVNLAIPASFKAGQRIPVKVNADWLACTDRVCVPQRGQLALDLTVGDGRTDPKMRGRFDAWRTALPVPIDRVGRYRFDGNRFSVAIPFPASASLDNPYLFPAESNRIDHMAPQRFRRTGDWLIMETAAAKSGTAPDTGQFSGLLRFGRDQGLWLSAKPGPVPGGGEYLATAGQAETPTGRALIAVLLAALAGGVLLNIMPCVFPILGLKALALARAGGDEASARHDALAYTAGVVLSCLVLGGSMLALRAGGEEIGWAFQLQEPGFILFLLLLMVGVTANLAGLFELGSVAVGEELTRNRGLRGSFWTGVLAALVATPCTGPFMAAALGAALLLPAAQALALFAALGFGIALPFLAIAYVPALRRRLPRPGPWLRTFRTMMAVPMGLTALALLWLLWRLTGAQGAYVGAGAALVVLLILQSGRFAFPFGRSIGAAKWVLAALVCALAISLLPGSTGQPVQRQTVGILKTEPFSEGRLAALRNRGKPVFVYFTADWCVSCKVNEAAVLETAETGKFFAEKGILVLRGDFTRRNAAIARFLAKHGAAGVPLYLYYPANGEAVKLPQLLSPAMLRETLS